MARPGYIKAQSVLEDSIPKIGTLIYEGTILSINNVATSTIIGGVILKMSKLSQLESVGVIGVSEDTGSVTGGRALGFGKGLGTLTGTGVGTVVADSNTVIFQLWATGTVASSGQLGPSQPAAGSTIKGTILALIQGV